MRILCLAVTLMVVMSCAVWASPVPILNPRPVPVFTSAEPSLQSIIDGIYFPGTVDVEVDQNPWGMFRNSSATPPGASAATLRAEFTSGLDSQIFGIFAPADSTSRIEQPIFRPSAVAATAAMLQWDVTGTKLSIFGDCTKLYCGENLPISFFGFGFFFASSESAPRFYTVDALTPGERTPRVLSFVRPGTGATEVVFAYEDGSDFDYQDMVVKVESIMTVVPEPAAVVLLGTVMLGIGGLVRRRMTK